MGFVGYKQLSYEHNKDDRFDCSTCCQLSFFVKVSIQTFSLKTTFRSVHSFCTMWKTFKVTPNNQGDKPILDEFEQHPIVINDNIGCAKNMLPA